ncbi:hypothetical protein QUF55_08850 [Clostridiaceae bacterium HSG29]|nr:hypothetical protein [Clostridiaceae bacterium HSG29]
MKKYRNLILIIFGILLVFVKIPYRSYSIYKIVLPAIYSTSSNSALHLSGIIWLVLIVLLIKEIKKINIGINSTLLIVAIIFLILPTITHIGNYLSLSVYRVKDGVEAVEVIDNWIHISNESEEITMYISLEMKNHSANSESFSVYLEMPENLKEIYGNENILLDNEFVFLNKTETQLSKEIILNTVYGKENMDINKINKNFRNYQILLIQENEKAKWHLTKF